MLAFVIADRASATIRSAEHSIRGLIAEAATSGEYVLISRLSGVARRLSQLAEQAVSGTSPIGEGPLPPIVGAEPRDAAKPSPMAKRVSSRTNGYPRFAKLRDMLVKIGWSKKERGEHVHKAPKAGVDAVVCRVMELGKDGRMFTTPNLLPVSLGNGDDLPGYQTYICLAWLRDLNAVKQHGREGYSIHCEDLAGTVDLAWDSLPGSPL